MNTATNTTATETATRFVGCCQICEGEQKLTTSHGMVHHGYKRPGDGEIHGDCPGVHAVPYEVSCDLIKTYLASVQSQLATLEARLVALKAGEVTHLTETKSRGAWHHPVSVERAVGVTDLYTWLSAVDSLRWNLEGRISQCKHEIARCTRRIAAWEPKAIRTVEEMVDRDNAAKAARKAERDAAKAAREAKKAATKAKQEALQAKRTALRAEFKAQLEALAATPESTERNAAANKIMAKIEKQTWMYFDEVQAEVACLTLGLATRETTNGHSHTIYHFTDRSGRRI